MIDYFKSAYGINLLLRIHGSAVYRAVLPGAVSVLIFLLIEQRWRKESDPGQDLNHPYGIGVLVSSVSFLIVFRANYGYQRYWEACTTVHHMMSKWLDATVHTAAFHMQSRHYDHIKPPSFFDHHDLNSKFLTRDRERNLEDSEYSDFDRSSGRSVRRSIEFIKDKGKRRQANITRAQSSRSIGKHPSSFSGTEPMPLTGRPRLDGNWTPLFDDKKSTFYDHEDEHFLVNEDQKWEGFASTKGGRTPILFLQELTHLSSLCVAVAFSTLRNDVEHSESPLDFYAPGSPWPEVDPTDLPRATKKEFSGNAFISLWRGMTGSDRSDVLRQRYNASRPMPVLGGVSDNELAFLQKAKGASAKTTLAWFWLSEFITREHLSGSTGNVAPPIISRLIQFLSDGMIYYNHARKIMFIPYPFPHAQLSAVYVLVMVFAIPYLMEQYTSQVFLGASLTFFTVGCLTGLHEVARELENPFRNWPNDIPLCTLLAMYNESLVTLYSGYHPDAFWEPDVFKNDTNGPSTKKGGVGVERSPRPTTADKKTLNPTTPPRKPAAQRREQGSTATNTPEKEQSDGLDDLKEFVRLQSEEIARLREMVENGAGEATKKRD